MSLCLYTLPVFVMCHLCLRGTIYDYVALQARLSWAKVLGRLLFGYTVLVNNRLVLNATVHHT